MTKIGETKYKKYGEELLAEKTKMDIIEEMIRRMRKESIVQRRPKEPNVSNKRRKIDDNEFEEMDLKWGRSKKRVEGEQRKEERDDAPNNTNKRRNKGEGVGQRSRGQAVAKLKTLPFRQMSLWIQS